MKIVINSCFGGFSLSEAGIRKYAELKGLALYPDKDRYGFTCYWTLPPEQRPPDLSAVWSELSLEVRHENNRLTKAARIYDRDIERNDPLLVEVVELLGSEVASGGCANLTVVDVPDDAAWEIAEYDGNEHVAEKHRSWFS